MTATKTAPAPSGYQSGHCSVGAHDRCKGGYAGVECTCTCHTEPDPEPEPTPAELYATVTHSAGVASVGYGGKLAHAVCSCGWAATEARSRNHDAFDDARAHLAVARQDAA